MDNNMDSDGQSEASASNKLLQSDIIPVLSEESRHSSVSTPFVDVPTDQQSAPGNQQSPKQKSNSSSGSTLKRLSSSAGEQQNWKVKCKDLCTNESVNHEEVPVDDRILKSGERNTISEICDSSISKAVESACKVITCADLYQVGRDQAKIDGHQVNFNGPVTINSGANQISQDESEENQAAKDQKSQRVPSSMERTPSFEDKIEADLPPVKYNLLCYDICEGLTDKQFKKMKRSVRTDNKNGGIPNDDINSPEDLLKCMERYGYLSQTNTWFLQYLLYHVDNNLLYKKVIEYCARQSSDQLFICSEPEKARGDGRSSVKLKVVGDIRQFREIEVEEFKQKLAKKCGEDIIYITAEGQKEGCVILYFDVPSASKDKFFQDLEDWCVLHGIFHVWFDNQEVTTLPHLESKKPNLYIRNADTILDVLKNNVDSVKGITATAASSLQIGDKPLLHLAAELNNLEMVKHLISQGAAVDQVDMMKATALHMAVFLNYSNICVELLKHMQDTDAINYADEVGNTALHLAVYQGNYELCSLLMEYKAKTDVKNKEHETVIDVGRTKHPSLLIYLLDEEMDITIPVPEQTLRCSICLLTFKIPRILPCGHSFCENCLEAQWRKSGKETVECALCKEPVVVPAGDIANIPVNKPLLQQLDEAKHIQEYERRKHEQQDIAHDQESDWIDSPKYDDKFNVSPDREETADIEMKLDATDNQTYGDLSLSALNEETRINQPCDESQDTQATKVHVTRQSLICPSCQERFKGVVRKLHCSHSFCEICIKQHINRNAIKCSLCNEETLCEDMNQLQIDYILQDQVEDVNKHDKYSTQISDNYARIDDDHADWNKQESCLTDTEGDDEELSWLALKKDSQEDMLLLQQVDEARHKQTREGRKGEQQSPVHDKTHEWLGEDEVKKVDSDGDVYVKTDDVPSYLYNPECLMHVAEDEEEDTADDQSAMFKKGDRVLIKDVPEEEMKKYQKESGRWMDMMLEYMNKTGVIVSVQKGKVCIVKMDDGERAAFYRGCLTLVEPAPVKESLGDSCDSNDNDG
ncbi:uncharacterized protein [Amphiura filiformis]|uniref:uncharacterized protein n=1 Tax=Amphiura filiformis TaxID=82378 RepID=UPI003B21E9FF